MSIRYMLKLDESYGTRKDLLNQLSELKDDWEAKV